MSAFKLWKEVPESVFGAPFKGGSISAEISPELLGVGYIIGPYVSGLMVGGGVLAYLVLIPAIKFFGDALKETARARRRHSSATMSPDEVRSAYVLYIGAGSVAAAGIISVIRSLPVIISSQKRLERFAQVADLFLGRSERPWECSTRHRGR